MAKCTSWLGHKFQARYSTEVPPFRGKDAAFHRELAILNKTMNRLYKGDFVIK